MRIDAICAKLEVAEGRNLREGHSVLKSIGGAFGIRSAHVAPAVEPR